VLPFRNSSLSNQGLALSRYVLVAVALIALLLAWNPPPLVGLFAQKGVYGIAAASFVPIIFGVWIRGPIPTWIAATAAAVGLGGHLILNLFLNVRNPSVSASWAMIASLVLAGLLLWIHRMNAKKPEPTTGGFS
jgi:SSS family solute:Na+ symporter/sodium/pantothenate symporter